MPISELVIPIVVNRTTLRLTISVLENSEGILTIPSFKVDLTNLKPPTLNVKIFFTKGNAIIVLRRA